MRLCRNDVIWQLPDDELVALFLASPAVGFPASRRSSLPTMLGCFLGGAHRDGGLQSVPLADGADDGSFNRVFAAIARARPDVDRGAGSAKAKARQVTAVAHNNIRHRRERAAYIRTIVDAAPPLSPQQKSRLRELFAPVVQRTSQEKSRVRHKTVAGGTCRIVGGTGEICLWWDGLAQFGWQLTEREFASRFLSSPFADRDRWPWSAAAVLTYFIGTDEDNGGLQSTIPSPTTTIETAAHQRVIDLIYLT